MKSSSCIHDTPATELRDSVRTASSRFAWSVALAAVLAAILVAVIALRPGEPPGSVRFTVAPPPGWTHSLDLTLGPPAVSPDGRYVAFSASDDVTGRVQRWVRDMDITKPFAFGGTDGTAFAFWSPDSRSLGFFADGYLKRTDLKGGATQGLCPVAVARGGSWSSDDVTIFAPSADGPLFRVNASGGAPQQLTQLDRAGVIGLEDGGDSTVALPLLATHLLWINLVTDGAPAPALGLDPADPDLMNRPPRPRGEGVITRRMWRGIFFVGAIIAAGTLLVIDACLPGGLIEGTGTLQYAQTMAFTTLVFLLSVQRTQRTI